LVFRQRVETLNRTLFQGRNIKYVAVPTDQVLSEDQLAKRTRHLSDNRGWEQKVNNLLNTVRKGYPLTDAYKQMVQVDAFDGYYTFGPAANFYVNKLGFDFIPSAIAPHKARWSDREKELLGRLKKHERLSDLELIEIFSGRGLIKKVSDFAMNSRLKLGSQSFKVKNVTGGIDLTSAKMNLETQNAGQRIKFHLDPALLAQLKNIPGFIPVVTNIQPLKSLPEFLGLKEASANASF